MPYFFYIKPLLEQFNSALPSTAYIPPCHASTASCQPPLLLCGLTLHKSNKIFRTHPSTLQTSLAAWAGWLVPHLLQRGNYHLRALKVNEESASVQHAKSVVATVVNFECHF